MRYMKIADERELSKHLQEEQAALLCGGTDLLVKVRSGLASPKLLLDISDVESLRQIRQAEGDLVIGAAVPQSDVLRHEIVRERLPLLRTVLQTLGSTQIRNRASLAGNLVNASPAADSAIALLLYDARVSVAGPYGERMLPLCELFAAPGQTSLSQGEYLRAVHVPIPDQELRTFYHKVGKRRALTIAIASVGALIRVDGSKLVDARFAAGSVAPTPLRLAALEEYLLTHDLNESSIEAAGAIARDAVSPIDDVRATAAYRRNVVGDLVIRCLKEIQGG